MIFLITGATHTGKTNFANKLMVKKKMPYTSQDHIKMGLIRTGMTDLTPTSSREALTKLLWPITREMIKTAIENRQDLIVEGSYIPLDWKKDFDERYLREIRFICLCFSDDYINKHFIMIKAYENCIERRAADSGLTVEMIKRENAKFRNGCEKNKLKYVLITDSYRNIIEKIENMS